MRTKLTCNLMALLCISILLSGCLGSPAPGEPTDKDSIEFQGILVHENSILITDSEEQQVAAGQLISLSFPEGMEAPPVGSLYQYEISTEIRESWPVQGSATSISEVELLAGHTVISFDTADAILQHLPQNTYFIDVRTVEEYESGHVSGAMNIPVDQVENDIPAIVPEKTDIIIVYCRSGNRSAQAGITLENLGYQVILDAGGIIDYKGEQVKGSEAGFLPGQP